MNLLGAQTWVIVVLVTTMEMVNGNIPSILGSSIYIPEEDLLGSLPNGISFFKAIPNSCLRKINTAVTVKDQTFYKNTAQFYKSIATETNLKASYEGSFSLGFTLDVTTKHIGGRNRSVTGTSLNLATKSYEHQLIPNCLYETAVKQRVLDDFSRLDTEISKPYHKVSWRKYQSFLQTHGSHIVTGVTYGSSINQYAFAEKQSSYSNRQLTVKACASFGYVAMASISACNGVTKAEISRVSNSKMTSSITVKGGTADTRNKLIYQRAQDLVLQFLNEGQSNPAPIEFTLTPIWQVLRGQRHAKSDNSNIQAVNLQFYYDGYLNFGCPYIPGIRGPVIQKFDFAAHSTPQQPVYECSVAPPGCHDPEDCHYQVGVKCACRGASCIRHSERKLENGVMRKTAAAYYGYNFQWQGCDWLLWGSQCTCKNESKKRVVISK